MKDAFTPEQEARLREIAREELAGALRRAIPEIMRATEARLAERVGRPIP